MYICHKQYYFSRNVIDTLRTSVMELGEPRQLLSRCPHCGDNRVVMARQIRKEEIESNPIFAEFLQQSTSHNNSPLNGSATTMAYRRASKGSRSGARGELEWDKPLSGG